MKSRCKKRPLVTEERINSKNALAPELQAKGLIKDGGMHEVTDDGIYELWTTPDRLNRKKVACFIDTHGAYMVCLPQDCSDYCRECDRDHGGMVAIPG